MMQGRLRWRPPPYCYAGGSRPSMALSPGGPPEGARPIRAAGAAADPGKRGWGRGAVTMPMIPQGSHEGPYENVQSSIYSIKRYSILYYSIM